MTQFCLLRTTTIRWLMGGKAATGAIRDAVGIELD
jgi:hypothetical protein